MRKKEPIAAAIALSLISNEAWASEHWEAIPLLLEIFAKAVVLIPLNLFVAGIFLKKPGFARPIILMFSFVWLLTSLFELIFFSHSGSFGGFLYAAFLADAYFATLNIRILMEKPK